MQFLDEAKIYVKSGDGGHGCVSFLREKFMAFGGPDGGNGGKGSDVVFECVANLNTLIDFRYQQHFKGQNGEPGKGKNRSGSSRSPMVIKVPVGTELVGDDKETVIYDFMNPGEKLLVLKGGNGGYGNAHYKSSVNQAPRRTTPGWPGQEMWVWLRLKLISDVGLVGLPNAGKSTFLASTTSAKPKIANYPFTTLKPQLGVVRTDDQEFVLADIPGLIEGAHEGIGLGDKFLKHVERCRTNIHLVSMDSDDLMRDYNIIRNELTKYGLADKKEIVVLSKADLLPEEEREAKRKEFEDQLGLPVMLLSCAINYNVKEVLRSSAKMLQPDLVDDY